MRGHLRGWSWEPVQWVGVAAAWMIGATCAQGAVTNLAPGDIAFAAVNTDNPDRFAFVALVDIGAGAEIHFTDSAWSNNQFVTSEDAGTWTAPGGGVSAGTVVTFEDADPGMTVSAGSWSGDDMDGLSASGDQLLAYQGAPPAPTFLAGISAGSGTGWITTGSPSTTTSYLPAGLGLGTNALQFTSDNGTYSGGMTNTADGLSRTIADENNWTTHSTLTPFGPWAFLVHPAYPTGAIQFVAINTDNPDRFAFVALTDLVAYTTITFTDEGWSNNVFVTSEQRGTWTAPGGGLAAGTVVTLEDTAPGMALSAGTWEGDDIDTLTDSGDQLLAYHGHIGNPAFLAGISAGSGTGWITDGSVDNGVSYLPAELAIGTNALQFTSDNGTYRGGMTNTAAGLRFAISDEANWLQNSTTRHFGPWDFLLHEALPAGAIQFVAINTDNPDRFAFLALQDIPEYTAIWFTDEGVSNGVFVTTEQRGVWYAPAGGLAAGSVVTAEDADPGMTLSAGDWGGDDIDTLTDTGDQLLAYQGYRTEPRFLAGISAGSGTGWITDGSVDNGVSYLPVELGIGTNALQFTADNGTFRGLMTNTASGLGRFVADAGNWSTDSSTRIFDPWAFVLHEDAVPGAIAFIAFHADGAESFSFVAIDAITPNSVFAITDNAWTNDLLASNEDLGYWVAPAAGLAAGSVVTLTDIGATMSASVGSWTGDDIGVLSTSGDQLLAFQGHRSLPAFVAGLTSTDWLTNGTPSTTESYLPTNLVQGLHALTFETASPNDNGFYHPIKMSGSRWGLLAAIQNEAAWVRSDSALTDPAWSFSAPTATPDLAAGAIAFVAFAMESSGSSNTFAFVAAQPLAAGTEIAFTDIGWDGNDLVPPLDLEEHTAVWTAPAGGVGFGTVIRIDGTNVSAGGGTMSGALSDLRISGDQILAFQQTVTNPVFVAGVSALGWRTTGAVDVNSSYLPAELLGGATAVSFDPSPVRENAYYSGTTVADDGATLRALVNDDANWTRSDDPLTWPVPWAFAPTAQPATMYFFR